MTQRVTLVLGKIIILLFPAIIGLRLLNSIVVPSGHLRLEYEVGGNTRSISDLGPAARVSEREKSVNHGGSYRRVHTDPVYFSVSMPRSFETAKVSLEFQNTNQPIVELGIQQSKNAWDYLLKPMDNKFIDNKDWYSVSDSSRDLVLTEKGDLLSEGQGIDDEESKLFRTQRFQSLDQFFKDMPVDKTIALYQTDLKDLYLISDYSPNSSGLEINTSLRGKHNFYTYIKDEALSLEIDFVDINRNIGPDRFHLNIYRGDSKLVYHQDLEDDDIIDASGQGTEKQSIEVDLPGLTEGIYRLEFDISDDLVIRKIKTDQHLLVAIDQIFPIDNSEEYGRNISDINDVPTRLYTKQNKLNFYTQHVTGIQTVLLNDEEYDITATKTRHKFESKYEEDGTLNTLTLPKNNLVVSGDGYFSLTPESYFDPAANIVKLRHNTELSQIDYVLAKGYDSPTEDNSWLTATQEYDLTKAYVDEDQTIRFMISAPGMSERGAEIKIRKIIVDLEREPLNLKNLVSGFKKIIKLNK
ncbi:hypothetical protein KKG41_03455 [Patescibacteria group bacterium]|nr:hypothetical protein [Patescibacteria group bacterium]MBU1890130.1 hypothetical protein [Patescibacteria group bacterium]